MPKQKTEKVYLLEVVQGVEGPSIYINDFRVAGPKPWGGGDTLYSFTVTAKDLKEATK